VGPLVLNVPFYNAALLARDVAATVQVTGGRFELGVGAGHAKEEFDDAGIPLAPGRQRIEYVGTYWASCVAASRTKVPSSRRC
jgi:alkanesulfonate monooxygenase SsuD/methylene tetrahydromethanopterin reductase-like flavin-dependent oxidoreductase (luciferase family)